MDGMGLEWEKVLFFTTYDEMNIVLKKYLLNTKTYTLNQACAMCMLNNLTICADGCEREKE